MEAESRWERPFFILFIFFFFFICLNFFIKMTHLPNRICSMWLLVGWWLRWSLLLWTLLLGCLWGEMNPRWTPWCWNECHGSCALHTIRKPRSPRVGSGGISAHCWKQRRQPSLSQPCAPRWVGLQCISAFLIVAMHCTPTVISWVNVLAWCPSHSPLPLLSVQWSPLKQSILRLLHSSCKK